MNFLEICQMVLDEGDRVGTTLEDVKLENDMQEHHRKVILWVQRAYRRIQRRSQWWKFHHNTGVFFTTLADGTQDYTKADVRNVLRDSIRARRQGTTNDYDLLYLTYKEWRDLFQVDELAPGAPVWFVELPDGGYRIEPGTDAVFEILADWYRTIDELTYRADVPLWDEELHEIIVWEALKDYASEYEASERLEPRIKNELPGLWTNFNRRYLPELEISAHFA